MEKNLVVQEMLMVGGMIKLIILILIPTLLFASKRDQLLRMDVFSIAIGLDEQDFYIDDDVMARSWQETIDYIESKETSDFVKEQVYLLKDFNLEAKSIWDEYSRCHGGTLNELRRTYIAKDRLCRNRRERNALKERMEFLKTNVKNWASTTRPGEDTDQRSWLTYGIRSFDEDKAFHMPVFHPFMGQIMVELFAHYRQGIRKSIGFKQSSTGTELDMSMISVDCDILNDRRGKCEEQNKLRHGYRLSKEILESSTRYCQNFGLYPNATIYPFMGHGLGGLFTMHPVANERKSQTESHHELIYLTDEDGEYYYFVFYDPGQEPRIMLGAHSPHNKERREEYIRVHAEENGYLGSKKEIYSSCWKDLDPYLARLSSFSNFSTALSYVPFINESVDFYADLFN